VDWAKKRGAADHFQILPYQEAPNPPMTPSLRRRAQRAVQVVTQNGDQLEAGRAVLYVFERIGYRRLASFLSRPPWIWLVEAGYRVVADHRPFWGKFLFRKSGPNCSS
jgi:predicted DCC family thiol-disulfide oxidoreductase YuxK